MRGGYLDFSLLLHALKASVSIKIVYKMLRHTFRRTNSSYHAYCQSQESHEHDDVLSCSPIGAQNLQLLLTQSKRVIVGAKYIPHRPPSSYQEERSDRERSKMSPGNNRTDIHDDFGQAISLQQREQLLG